MRIAIISDIHANLEALNKAFEIISGKNVDEIIALGDTVGYGSNPNECVDLLREKTDYVLLGNHDQAAIDISVAEYFNPTARIAAEWTTRELTEANKTFLRELSYEVELDDLLFVHSSPFEPNEWHYILTPANAGRNFDYFTQRLCFIGHTHEPAVYCEDVWTREVQPGKRYIINVGSVGQPRDNDPRLSFGIYDTESGEYENVRSAYDMRTASEKIRKVGLPPMLADRILVGK